MAHKLTEADDQIQACLRDKLSFAVVAGAGSGKTTSLISALNFVRREFGRELRRDGQKIACITYTKRACAVISERLDFDQLFDVSTIHSFLWRQISRYTDDIRSTVGQVLIPAKLEVYQERDNGGQSQRAKEARKRIAELQLASQQLPQVKRFDYDDNQFSNFGTGQIGHDDVIELAAQLILDKPVLRQLIGHQFPYIFVDEAQDTFARVVDAFNLVCANDGLPIVGYFGDPMQQIYETGVGDFTGPPGSKLIKKEENFRSATSIITLANALRSDLQQEPGGDNAEIEGTVGLTLIAAEEPAAPRHRYTDEQLDRALVRFDQALDTIGWQDSNDAKRLYLVRQMIARRMGFLELHRLFTGRFASSRAQDEFEDGTHFLLKPFTQTLCPLLRAAEARDQRCLLGVLRDTSPAFDVKRVHQDSSLREMLEIVNQTISEFTDLWESGHVRDILDYARSKRLCGFPERLLRELDREPRTDEFDPEQHSAEKSDWLVDEFLSRKPEGLLAYADFVADNTAFSTQHGVKGEEYDDVLVVFDDIEAGWNQYSFNKLLIPGVAGQGTEGQIMRSRRLTYVCFTRARKNLRIILFCPSPAVAKAELIAQDLFKDDQISILKA